MAPEQGEWLRSRDSNPEPCDIQRAIVELRRELVDGGLDAGAQQADRHTYHPS